MLPARTATAAPTQIHVDVPDDPDDAGCASAATPAVGAGMVARATSARGARDGDVADSVAIPPRPAVPAAGDENVIAAMPPLPAVPADGDRDAHRRGAAAALGARRRRRGSAAGRVARGRYSLRPEREHEQGQDQETCDAHRPAS